MHRYKTPEKLLKIIVFWSTHKIWPLGIPTDASLFVLVHNWSIRSWDDIFTDWEHLPTCKPRNQCSNWCWQRSTWCQQQSTFDWVSVVPLFIDDDLIRWLCTFWPLGRSNEGSTDRRLGTTTEVIKEVALFFCRWYRSDEMIKWIFVLLIASSCVFWLISRLKMFGHAHRYTNSIVEVATCDAFKVSIYCLPSFCDWFELVFIFEGPHLALSTVIIDTMIFLLKQT